MLTVQTAANANVATVGHIDVLYVIKRQPLTLANGILRIRVNGFDSVYAV